MKIRSARRFEVIYTFLNETSTSVLNFVTNQSPSNGSCSINPLNGTTTTAFNISCSNWFDSDGVRDYTLYVWTKDISEKIMISYSSVDHFQVRLPIGNENTSLINLIVYIRDFLGSITQVNISSIAVTLDFLTIDDLFNKIQNSSKTITDNSIVQLLSSGNQNIVSQIIILLSQQLNQMNNHYLTKAISNGISFVDISISTLNSPNFTSSTTIINETISIEYKNEINSLANIRDYFVSFISDLLITTSNSIILQSSSLVQLTQSTNQLTRNLLTIVTNQCYQLSLSLYSIANQISYEDVQLAANQLFQCASNIFEEIKNDMIPSGYTSLPSEIVTILSGVNGLLQRRTILLDLDYSRSNTITSDYDTDLESPWSNLNLFADENDFSEEIIEKNRNIYYQKQVSNEISKQVTEMNSLLSLSLNIHRNLGQQYLLNNSQAFLFFEKLSKKSLENGTFHQIENSQFNFPSNLLLNSSSTISIRSQMTPLASFGNAQNTNLSRSISISILDENGNEISISTNENSSIRLRIPRDPNLLIPSMNFQNVTSIANVLFYLSYVNITSSIPISIDMEIEPLNSSLSYLFIYKFDQIPLLNSSINEIDGWNLFCSNKHLTNENLYKYFLDNQRTLNHQSLIYGIRQLNSTEFQNYCSNSSLRNQIPITDEKSHFTSNYQIRIYTSGCYYLDENYQWRSDGLKVGSLTNHYETECYSTHLTTFAGGFIVLPNPINWNYVFANADFSKNQTIYITMIYKKDLEKLGVTPLIDNQKSDGYFYQIIVFTGQRKDAGTESKVHFVLSGEKDQTNIRTFSNSNRKIFERGGIDAFVMSVPKSLGLLNYIRIWHDNSAHHILQSIRKDFLTENYYLIPSRQQ
ncbi:hypothetical protein I4U23_017050 [Adineta vaga]|nr:hypothetical protein I4U23_017050 [Adineta vaga]